MQTKLLIKLLEDVVEINRAGKYFAAFRYGIDTESKENLAIDIYKGDKNLFHSIAKDSEDLKRIMIAISSLDNSTGKYRIHYQDEYVSIDETLPNESLAASKAFKLKQQYNINVNIIEVMNVI